MCLVAFDLDDTLMTCGHDYDDAMNEFGEFVSAKTGIAKSEAVETLDEIDAKNVEEYGLSMDRFSEGFVEAYEVLVENPNPEDVESVRNMGESVFKSVETYAERGFMPGAEQILQELRDNPVVDLHLITAGDSRVQDRKIKGLNLDEFFDNTHVVPMGGKEDKLTELMETTGNSVDETVMIGNSLTSDIKSAINADARAVYIPNHEWQSTENAEYYKQHDRVEIYDSLGDLSEDCPQILHNGAAANPV